MDATPDAQLGAAEFAEGEARDALSIQTAWLRSFLAVADCGGFSAATLRLHLSQSRVSAHVAALEHALGVSLFERKSRPTCTTEAGELFRGHAQAALQQLQRGVEAARSTLDQFVAHIVVGSYPSVSSVYLPGVLAVLKSEHASISVELSEGTAHSLERAVTTGSADVIFRPLLPRMRDATLCHRAIWREDIVAVMREDDPLAKQASVAVSDLADRPLIGNPSGTEEDGGGFDLRHTLGGCAADANIAYLTDHPATLVALVRSAFGIGLINRLALETTGAEGLAIRAIDSPTAHRDVAVFWSGRRADSAVIHAFLRAQELAPLPAGVQPIAARQAAAHSPLSDPLIPPKLK
jgi:DNA-binding transcriptional LysR family regulator